MINILQHMQQQLQQSIRRNDTKTTTTRIQNNINGGTCMIRWLICVAIIVRTTDSFSLHHIPIVLQQSQHQYYKKQHQKLYFQKQYKKQHQYHQKNNYSFGGGYYQTQLQSAIPIQQSPSSSILDTTATTVITPTTEPKVGVLLLNLGGPEKEDDVEGFLYNLFADPDIIRLPSIVSPLQNVIAYIISKRRAPKSREAYESIGGGSPILQYSNEQAQLMKEAIQKKYGLAVSTYIGMRYWYPFTEEALEQIRRDQIDALVIVPLYPQFSISTSGSSLRVLQEEFSKNPHRYNGMVHTVVPSWYARTGYVNAMVDLIDIELQKFTLEEIRFGSKTQTKERKPVHVLFSAHGVPKSYIEAGDPYQQQIVECVDLISKELLQRRNYKELVEIHLSYQSRVGPIEWLRPYTDDVLPTLGQANVKNLVVVPISFVSEHVETLEEIDIEYRELAEEYGVTNWKRCPALNTNPAFIEDMADLVVEALQEPTQSVTEACVTNNVGNVELQATIDERLGINTAGVQGVGGTGVVQERWTGRIAIFLVTTILFVEFISGQSFVSIVWPF